jgi:hypothetical protein
MLDHARQRRRASAGSASCPCEKTLKVLAYNGGRHARKILEHELDDVFRWTSDDVLEHLAEEEAILGDYARAGLFPQRTFDRIVREHQRFRAQIARTGDCDREELLAHAKMEDEAVVEAGLL